MKLQQLPEVSQLTFLLALARTMPHRSPGMEHQGHSPPLSRERARQEALRLLGFEINTEDRE